MLFSWLLGRRYAQLQQCELRLDELIRSLDRVAADVTHLEQLAAKIRSRVAGAQGAALRRPTGDVNERILRGEFPTSQGGV